MDNERSFFDKILDTIQGVAYILLFFFICVFFAGPLGIAFFLCMMIMGYYTSKAEEEAQKHYDDFYPL